MNGKGGRQGKWKERGERINTVAASTGKAGNVEAALQGLTATQKNFSSSASSVSLSGALVHAFLTSCGGKTLGSVRVSPTCPHPLHSSSATVLPHARGLLVTHRIKSHLRHLGTLQQAARSQSPTHPHLCHQPTLLSGLFHHLESSSILCLNIYQLADLKLFDLSDGITYSSRFIFNSQTHKKHLQRCLMHQQAPSLRLVLAVETLC